MATIHTTCRLCLVRCGISVETEDTSLPKAVGDGLVPRPSAEIVRFIGNREHPLSRGYLCVKGKSSVTLMDSPNRVIYPQKRVGERGSGRWQRVTWNEALDDIGRRLGAIINKHGSRAVAVQALPPKEYFAYDLLLDAIGSPTFFKHDAHSCFTPQMMADTLTFGNLLTYPSFMDVSDCGMFLLWGINMPETNGSKGLHVRNAVRRGARTVVVDPRPTRSAREADLWLRIRPGTDAALALGMIHVMIREGWYDREFVDNWTEGFAELAERAQQYPPERVASITWIPAQDIVEATRLFATTDTSAMYTFIGATMGGNSIATLRLMGFLPALTGRLDQTGNNCFLSPSGVRMPSYFSNSGARPAYLAQQISADKFPLFAGPEAITSPYPHPKHVVDAILTGKPYPVRALWTNCNPLVGLEDTYRVKAALEALDLLIVSDMFESPTAHLADYILPVTNHMESNAITEYSGLNMISARVRVVEPRGEAREEGEVVLDVARRLGVIDKFPADTYQGLLDYRLAPIGINFERFAEMGSYVREDRRSKYQDGSLRRDGKPGFNTPSGKIEFASRKLAQFDYDPVPDFVEPPYSPYASPETAQQYPLILISGTRSVEFYSTLGIETQRLRKRRPWPTLEMGEETAAEYGLVAGDWVSIESPATEHDILRQVAILPGMHPRVVNAEGLWYMPGDDPVAGTLKVGANVLTPLRDDLDPVMGGSIARCMLCRINRVEAPALDSVKVPA